MTVFLLIAFTWAILGLALFPALADCYLENHLSDFYGWLAALVGGPFIWCALVYIFLSDLAEELGL